MNLGKILYAIDHNTGQLDGNILAEQLEVRGEEIFNLAIKFDGGPLQMQYETLGPLGHSVEGITISPGKNGFYNVEHNILINGTMYARVQSRMKGLHQVEYSKQISGTRAAFRNKLGEDGPKLVQYSSMLKDPSSPTGGTSVVLIEVMSAMKAYQRNKAKGILRENKEEREQKNTKARSYQSERREYLRFLKSNITSARAIADLGEYSGNLVISSESVCKYAYEGLMEAAKKLKVAKTTHGMLVNGNLTKPESFSSGVEAIQKIAEVAEKVRTEFTEKSLEKSMKTTPVKMQKLIAEWNNQAKKAGVSTFNEESGEQLIHFFSGVCNSLQDYYSYHGKMSELVDESTSGILSEIESLDGKMTSEEQLRSKEVYHYGVSLLNAIKAGIKKK